MPKKPVLLYACFGVDPTDWIREIRTHGPDIELRIWPDAGDTSEIDYVLAWNAPAGFWGDLPSLKAIFSMGAGVDKVLADKELPDGLPLIRMVDPSLAIGMNEFVLLRVLHYHRLMPAFETQQRSGEWKQLRPKLPQDRTVGILGLGELGGAAARTLVRLGFDVGGWSRNPKSLDGVKTFSGPDGLVALAERSEILVCLLPLTNETRGILNAELFSAMQSGSYVINVARGAHLVEEDLLAALDSGKLAGATLDVFATEPLPAAHRFWTHPAVTVVPHAAALTQPKTAAEVLVRNLLGHARGEPLQHVVDRSRGY